MVENEPTDSSDEDYQSIQQMPHELTIERLVALAQLHPSHLRLILF
jgi:hypothetical protein